MAWPILFTKIQTSNLNCSPTKPRRDAVRIESRKICSLQYTIHDVRFICQCRCLSSPSRAPSEPAPAPELAPMPAAAPALHWMGSGSMQLPSQGPRRLAGAGFCLGHQLPAHSVQEQDRRSYTRSLHGQHLLVMKQQVLQVLAIIRPGCMLRCAAAAVPCWIFPLIKCCRGSLGMFWPMATIISRMMFWLQVTVPFLCNPVETSHWTVWGCFASTWLVVSYLSRSNDMK